MEIAFQRGQCAVNSPEHCGSSAKDTITRSALLTALLQHCQNSFGESLMFASS